MQLYTRLSLVWAITPGYGTRGLATPNRAGVCALRAPPTKPAAASGPGRTVGCIVLRFLTRDLYLRSLTYIVG